MRAEWPNFQDRALGNLVDHAEEPDMELCEATVYEDEEHGKEWFIGGEVYTATLGETTTEFRSSFE